MTVTAPSATPAPTDAMSAWTAGSVRSMLFGLVVGLSIIAAGFVVATDTSGVGGRVDPSADVSVRVCGLAADAADVARRQPALAVLRAPSFSSLGALSSSHRADWSAPRCFPSRVRR
jgi:hypothetical protein